MRLKILYSNRPTLFFFHHSLRRQRSVTVPECHFSAEKVCSAVHHSGFSTFRHYSELQCHTKIQHCYSYFKVSWMYQYNDDPKILMGRIYSQLLHIFYSKFSNSATIGSNNGLSPFRHPAFICWFIVNWALALYYRKIGIKIRLFSLKKIALQMLSATCCRLSLDLNALSIC